KQMTDDKLYHTPVETAITYYEPIDVPVTTTTLDTKGLYSDAIRETNPTKLTAYIKLLSEKTGLSEPAIAQWIGEGKTVLANNIKAGKNFDMSNPLQWVDANSLTKSIDELPTEYTEANGDFYQRKPGSTKYELVEWSDPDSGMNYVKNADGTYTGTSKDKNIITEFDISMRPVSVYDVGLKRTLETFEYGTARAGREGTYDISTRDDAYLTSSKVVRHVPIYENGIKIGEEKYTTTYVGNVYSSVIERFTITTEGTKLVAIGVVEYSDYTTGKIEKITWFTSDWKPTGDVAIFNKETGGFDTYHDGVKVQSTNGKGEVTFAAYNEGVITFTKKADGSWIGTIGDKAVATRTVVNGRIEGIDVDIMTTKYSDGKSIVNYNVIDPKTKDETIVTTTSYSDKSYTVQTEIKTGKNAGTIRTDNFDLKGNLISFEVDTPTKLTDSKGNILKDSNIFGADGKQVGILTRTIDKDGNVQTVFSNTRGDVFSTTIEEIDKTGVKTSTTKDSAGNTVQTVKTDPKTGVTTTMQFEAGNENAYQTSVMNADGSGKITMNDRNGNVILTTDVKTAGGVTTSTTYQGDINLEKPDQKKLVQSSTTQAGITTTKTYDPGKIDSKTGLPPQTGETKTIAGSELSISANFNPVTHDREIDHLHGESGSGVDQLQLLPKDLKPDKDIDPTSGQITFTDRLDNHQYQITEVNHYYLGAETLVFDQTSNTYKLCKGSGCTEITAERYNQELSQSGWTDTDNDGTPDERPPREEGGTQTGVSDKSYTLWGQEGGGNAIYIDGKNVEVDCKSGVCTGEKEVNGKKVEVEYQCSGSACNEIIEPADPVPDP
ncbi:MAG: hypothetical protein V1944_01600, partial [Candidatus Aenigmatarchaeota archaeon]